LYTGESGINKPSLQTAAPFEWLKKMYKGQVPLGRLFWVYYILASFLFLFCGLLLGYLKDQSHISSEYLRQGAGFIARANDLWFLFLCVPLFRSAAHYSRNLEQDRVDWGIWARIFFGFYLIKMFAHYFG
jgi:hypothetical protein